MRKIPAVTAMALAVLAVGACNTVKGLGEDIESVSQAGDDEI